MRLPESSSGRRIYSRMGPCSEISQMSKLLVSAAVIGWEQQLSRVWHRDRSIAIDRTEPVIVIDAYPLIDAKAETCRDSVIHRHKDRDRGID